MQQFKKMQLCCVPILFLLLFAYPTQAQCAYRFFVPGYSIEVWDSQTQIAAQYRYDGESCRLYYIHCPEESYWSPVSWNAIKEFYNSGQSFLTADFLYASSLQKLNDHYLAINYYYDNHYPTLDEAGCITLKEENVPEGAVIIDRIENGPIFFRVRSKTPSQRIAPVILMTKNYEPTGNLKIDITPPAAVTGGGKWAISGVDSGELNSGATYSDLPVGTYTVSFTSVQGWRSPASRQVIVRKGETTSVTAEYRQSSSTAPMLSSIFSLLLADTGTYTETDQYYAYESQYNGATVKVLAFKGGADDIEGAVVSNTLNNTIVTTNYYPANSHTRVVMTTNNAQEGFLVDLANTTDILSHLSSLTAGADAANKSTLDDFIRNYSPQQSLNNSLNRLEVTLPKTIAQYLTTTTYQTRILDSVTISNQLSVLDDDPVIGWYFNDTAEQDEIDYTLPGDNEGGIIISFQEPIIFDDSLTKVTFKMGEAVAAYETCLFRVSDLEDGLILPKNDTTEQAYDVSISNLLHTFNVLYETPLEFERELYSYILSYTSDGKCSLDPNVGTPVYLSLSNMNYKISVFYGPEPPDRATYSCLGSVDQPNSKFGDAGFTLNRIWIGVVPR